MHPRLIRSPRKPDALSMCSEHRFGVTRFIILLTVAFNVQNLKDARRFGGFTPSRASLGCKIPRFDHSQFALPVYVTLGHEKCAFALHEDPRTPRTYAYAGSVVVWCCSIAPARSRQISVAYFSDVGS